MARLSVLDQSPVRSGATPADAIRETLALARRCDELGYTRYWLAEHHSTPALAGSATAVLIGQVAAVTSGIRVGSVGDRDQPYSQLQGGDSLGCARRALRRRVLFRSLHQRRLRRRDHTRLRARVQALALAGHAAGQRRRLRRVCGEPRRGRAAGAEPRSLHRAALHGPRRALPHGGRGGGARVHAVGAADRRACARPARGGDARRVPGAAGGAGARLRRGRDRGGDHHGDGRDAAALLRAACGGVRLAAPVPMSARVPDFREPSRVERIFNKFFGLLVGLGLAPGYNYLVEVRGRKTGRVYTAPVNLLEIGSRRFLVAPRGRTQWVRNAE